jgi:hypothetical protein
MDRWNLRFQKSTKKNVTKINVQFSQNIGLSVIIQFLGHQAEWDFGIRLKKRTLDGLQKRPKVRGHGQKKYRLMLLEAKRSCSFRVFPKSERVQM